MFKSIIMIGLFLVLSQSSPLLAGENNPTAITKAAGQANTKRVSTTRVCVNAVSTKQMVACSVFRMRPKSGSR